MPVISGNISGSIKSVPFDIPATIKSFSLTNKTSGAITVTLGMVVSGVDIYIFTISLGANLSQNIDLTEIKMLAGYKILIIASGSCDYYISIE